MEPQMSFTITANMLMAIAPQLILSFGIVLVLLLIAWQRSQLMVQRLTQAILIVALISNFKLLAIDSLSVTLLLKVDSYSAFAFILVALSSLTVVSLSRDFLKNSTEVHDEYYLLILLVTLGASILIVSDHFASLFLGFELISIALVGLVGYAREQKYAVETGFKYLILSATASSFMLLGIAFIYSQTGQLTFSQVNIFTSAVNESSHSIFFALGLILFIVGIAFKLSLAPFHFWTPDIYQGAPTPITLLLATVSKVAMFVVLMKCWFLMQHYYQQSDALVPLMQIISLIAIMSMLIGNLLALKQTNIKRLLGYSSIAHMGYLTIVLLVSFNESIDFAWQSALFYLSAYVLATVSLFTVLLSIEKDHFTTFGEQKELTLNDFSGMFWQNRALALLVVIALLSLAGVPLSMGFIGKFYLLSHAVTFKLWWLIAALVIGSGISLFYYLRIIFILFDTETQYQFKSKLQFSHQLLVVFLAMVGLAFGVFPDTLSQLLVLL